MMQLLSKISFTVFLFAVGIQVVAQQTDTSSADTVKHFETRHTRDDKKLDPKTEKAIKKGNRYFAHGPEKYEDALQEYLKAFNAHPDNSYVNFKIGQCYLLGRKSKNMAVHYLERAYLHSRKVDKLITYYLAKAYQINDNFDGSIEMYQKSIRAFKRAGRKSPTSHGHLLSRQQVEQGIAMCKKGITECETATDIIERPIRVYIENMGDSINSEYPDYDPYISGDESMLFFTSRRQDTRGGKLAEIDAGYYEDIYIAKKVNGHWRKAERMHNRFNKKTNDAIIGLSNDGKKMFVYRDSDNGDIYLSYLEKGEWGAPKYLKGINSAHHESSACFSHDETAIFFTSDRPGGIGYSDIYMSKRKENFKWSEPVNLGPKINSPYDEERVYLHPNGKELYFASQGHNSIGGFDIFKSTLNTEDSTWSEPVNIGYPINTSDDEVSFVIAANGKRGYYASIQPFGLGEKDIYVATFLDYDTMDVAEIKKAFITVANKVDTLGMLAPLLSNAELHDLEQMNDILKEKEQQLNMLKMALEDVYNTVILVPDEDLEEGQTKKDIEQMQENIRQQEEQIISIRATLLEAEDAAQLMELEKVEAQNLQHIKQLKQEVEQQEEQLTNFRLDLKEAEDVAMAYPNKKNRKAAEGLKAQIQEAKEEINYMKLDLKDAQEHAAMLTDKTYERLSEDASPEERMAKEEEELELLNLELMDAVDVAIMQMDEATALALREKRAEVSEKEEELIQLQMKLMETKDPEIEVDEQTMAALAALENQVKEKETELTVLRLELKKAVDDAVIQVDEELRAEILDLEQKVTEKEQRVIGMKLKLFARDDVEMVLPETELAEKDEALDIETLQMQIEAKQYELENLRETLKEVEKTEFPTEEEKQQAITVMQQQIANKEQELTQLQLTLNNALALVQQEKEVIVLKNNEIPEKAVKWQVRYTEKEEELPSGLVVYYMDENDNIIHKEPIDKKGFFTYHELPPNQEYIFKVMF
ncbi:PD40 domain-containing protein, partial [Bacteroidales bacterium AH-315-I05]|nr:PD40 domain-containing protein [Bacteroidales bacterium AH-315-I05]